MFAFRKKNKPHKQIAQLLDLLKADPENTKHRLKLADSYLRAGNKKTAIVEYQTAAKSLTGEGFNLKAISIYKKILTLNSMSLDNHKSLAALYTSEGLLAEARRTYEKILQIRPEDREAREALDRLEKGGESASEQDIGIPRQNTENPFEMVETQATDDSHPVPIETILAPSEDEGTFPDPFSNLPGETPGSSGVFEDSKEEEDVSRGYEEDMAIDPGNTQTDNAFEMSAPPGEVETDVQRSPHGTVLRDLTAEDISNTDPETEEIEPPNTNPPPSDSPPAVPANILKATQDSSGEDSNLHYHLGVAYREMELTDKAIEEFIKALEQGTKPLECLIMLARCHFEKGLFQDATDFIHRALKLRNLSQEQIDQLHHQLEEVQAIGNLR